MKRPKAPRGERATASDARPREDAEAPALPQLYLNGEPPNGFAPIVQVNGHLHLAMGSTDEENRAPVILPYLRLSFVGPDEEEFPGESDFMALVTFDNAAFVIDRLAEDFATATKQLEGIAGGRISPEPVRLDFTRKRLENSVKQLEAAIASLSGTLDRSGSAPPKG